MLCTYGYAENGILKFNICYNKTTSKYVETEFTPYEDSKINEIIGNVVKKMNYTGTISFDIEWNGE
ncbi:MAG: hypothetical protein R3Y54_12085 [Eubacteriales bacterium]